MNDYTPTTEEVRDQWREMWSYDHSENGSEQRDAQFDRWLASVKAEAWDECWNAIQHRMDVAVYPAPNPYREAVTE